MSTPRLSKTGIEYLTHVWNFMSGCSNYLTPACPVGKNCWAHTITTRFESHYPGGFKPTFYADAFLSPLSLKKPARIGVCFMGDLFCDEVAPLRQYSKLDFGGLKDQILWAINQCRQHTFVFLTKSPLNLIKWSPFPNNCIVMASACTTQMTENALKHLRQVEAKFKGISFEPLYEEIDVDLVGIQWGIIGQQTKPDKSPMPAWVEKLTDRLTSAGAAVFHKDNLAYPFTSIFPRRQEYAV